MKPITMTVRALRRLALNAYKDATRTHIACVRFEPSRVAVTDGHMIAVIPLPADPERGFSLSAVAALESTDGAGPAAIVTIDRVGEVTRIAVAGRSFVAVVKDDKAQPFPPIDQLLSGVEALRGTDAAGFMIDARFYARAGEIAADLGVWMYAGVKHEANPITITRHGGEMDPVSFTFAAEHGTGQIVVMPVRR